MIGAAKAMIDVRISSSGNTLTQGKNLTQKIIIDS